MLTSSGAYMWGHVYPVAACRGDRLTLAVLLVILYLTFEERKPFIEPEGLARPTAVSLLVLMRQALYQQSHLPGPLVGSLTPLMA